MDIASMRSRSVAKLEAMSALRNSAIRHCILCSGNLKYYRDEDFLDHLRREHSKREGGSFVCRYGNNNLCQTLPLEGVSGPDFEHHIRRVHLQLKPEVVCSLKPSSSCSSMDSMYSMDTKHVPCLVTDSQKNIFTFYSGTQNLSSVLSDPRKSRREIQAFFTRHWGDSFSEHTKPIRHPTLPLISHTHFSLYIASVGKRIIRHMKDERKMANYMRGRMTLIGPGGANFEQKVREGTNDKDRVKPDLSAIPKIFVSPKFDLKDRDQFEGVFLHSEREMLELDSNNSNNFQPESGIFNEQTKLSLEPLKKSKILHEKLSYYLEIIDSQIDRQISSQSAAFFHSMTSHDQLQSYLAQTKYAVQSLRKHIAEIDETLVKKGFSAVMCRQSRLNRVQLLDKLRLIATVRETQPTVQMLLNSCDYLGALDIIATTQEVLKQELQGLVCFRHLNLQLCELSNVISKMLQEEFVNHIKSEVNLSFEQQCAVIEAEDSLTSILVGLFRVKEYRFCQVLKQEINNSCIELVRNIVGEYCESDQMQHFSDVESQTESMVESVTTSNLGDNLRRMDFTQFLNLVNILFVRLLRFVSKVQLVETLLVDILDVAGGKIVTSKHRFTQESLELCNSVDETDYMQMREQISDCTYYACNIAQQRMVKVVTAKGKDGFFEKCPAEELTLLTKQIECFNVDCENLCPGKTITVLKLCLQQQTSKMVTRFNADKKAKLGNILDSEHWKVAQVPTLFQSLVDNCMKTGKLRDVVHKDTDHTPKQLSNVLVVEGDEFVVVGTSLLLVQMLAQYCALLEQLPTLCPELLLGVIDLLKNFNSRTCQLILGAGALQLVGLKTISARNLALACRCLQLLSKFIPIVRIEFESHLSVSHSNLKRHFNSVTKDYEDHIHEIFGKLLSILEHVIGSSLQSWELKPPAPSPQFQQIAKQIHKFHLQIKNILPNQQLQKLFLRFHDAFKFMLRQRLKELNVSIQGSSFYSFVCSEFGYYMETMKSIECVASINDSLTDVLVEK